MTHRFADIAFTDSVKAVQDAYGSREHNDRVQEKAVRVIGMREGYLEATMEIVASGLFDPTGVITSVHAFDNVLDAYRRAEVTREWIPLLTMEDPGPSTGDHPPVTRSLLVPTDRESTNQN